MVEQAHGGHKAALRERARARRAGVPAQARVGAAQAACAHFLAGTAPGQSQDIVLGPGGSVALYWPVGDEIDPRPLIRTLLARGNTVLLPATKGDEPLVFRQWLPGAPLSPSGFGTLAPDADALAMVPDIVVMPLLAFDVQGTRLGYGRGHYDRTLAGMTPRPVLVGYAYSVQELPLIPREVHDVPLDFIVTEKALQRFGGAR